MFRTSMFGRLSTKLTVAFLLAAISGVALVAVLAYRATSGDFGAFLHHMEGMGSIMSGMMGGQNFAQAERDFLDNLRQTLWIAGLSGVALALFLGALFTRQIVSPLGKVAAAAQHISQGDLNQRVDTRGSGELAELGKSFNLMAATLSHDQELRQNMVADIAHEIRTPLSIMQGNVEAMLDGIIAPDTENLTSVHQEIVLLARLVEDLRTLSLAETGQLEFQPRAIDLKKLSSQVIDSFKSQLISKNLSVVLEAKDDIPQCLVDPDRTAQVMRNLLSNAIHYTPEGGKIIVRLDSDRNGITASVIDSGIGIPTEDLPHVFERFYRVDRSRTRSTGGSGLGLAIVKQLVEVQGGQVWAESAKGKGSTFAFRVPLFLPDR